MRVTAELIKQAVRPADYYRRALPALVLKRPAWNDGGLCPFHDDKQRGSFRIHAETGGFMCFACGAGGGDIIAFEMKRHGIGFSDALAKMAQEWGFV